MGGIGSGRQPSEDTKEQINMCLTCPLDECINCLDPSYISSNVEEEAVERIKEMKSKGYRLNKSDRAVLKAYPFSTTDQDMADRLGMRPSTTGVVRRRLRLPTLRWTNFCMREKLVALWLRE